MSHKSSDALSDPACEPLAALPAAAPLPGTAGEARGQVVRVLQERADRCGSAVGERALADLLLAVSELLTNAVRHGGGVTRFEVVAWAREVRVTVGDRSTDLPRRRSAPRHGGEGGYGWALVRELATEVTLVLERDGGKRITVKLPLA
ncbi:ATP-binding protein [Streptomyces sp. NPDC087300]|uniref:ATP-binding protein n=1 Tax=Streptomyces sp. NPDC087300 TaxID=3365780 RepID=UPI003827F55F